MTIVPNAPALAMDGTTDHFVARIAEPARAPKPGACGL